MCNPDYLRFSSAVLIPSTVPESSLFISLLFIFIFFGNHGVSSPSVCWLWWPLEGGHACEPHCPQERLQSFRRLCQPSLWLARVSPEIKVGESGKSGKKGFIAGWLEHTGRNVERTEQSREGSLEPQHGDLRQNLWCSLCWPWTCCAAGLQLSLLHIPGAGFPGVSTTPLPE